MEKVEALDMETVVSLLTQGRKLADELKRQLNPTTTSKQTCDFLLEKIVSSYEKALRLLDCVAVIENGEPSHIDLSNRLESPKSIECSDGGEGSEHGSKDRVPVCKKRKTSPRSTEQVRVRTPTGFEGQPDDGYSWRKYGQKDILGSGHPRAYYRCTHRHTQGCLATKQVQRADEDPSIFEILYRGKHSCIQERTRQNNLAQKKAETQRHSQEANITTEPGLKTEPQELPIKEEQLPSFSFSSPPIESENVEANFFLETGHFVGTSYSPPFVSPATSDSYFSLSPIAMNDFWIGNSLESSESEFAEIISSPTPVIDISLRDLDCSIGEENFDSLDILNYY